MSTETECNYQERDINYFNSTVWLNNVKTMSRDLSIREKATKLVDRINKCYTQDMGYYPVKDIQSRFY